MSKTRMPDPGDSTADRQGDGGWIDSPNDHRFGDVLRELQRIDLAVYRAVEQTPTPIIDAPLRHVSRLADHSKLWFAIAAVLFACGGRSGRGAAVAGVVAIGLDSFLVNVPLKSLARRARPERDDTGGAQTGARHVRMPTSGSFPSGHSASAFAFATVVGSLKPELAMPLRGLATIVAYSRVHSGVHYPGDVLIGSLVGAAVGESTVMAARALVSRQT